MDEIRIRNSWDFKIVYPLVFGYLRDRNWPVFTSITSVQDYLETVPVIGEHKFIRIEWDIANALNDCGYLRISAKGKGFARTCLGIETVPEPASFRELAEIAV
jgi:hypothetical protein